MSNVDINVDRRTDRQKIGCLYRILLQAGAIKTNTLVSATVSSDTGQLGIDYLTYR